MGCGQNPYFAGKTRRDVQWMKHSGGPSGPPYFHPAKQASKLDTITALRSD
ncbi:MAG: hypothetical protein V3R23_00850 [Nitrospinaceae bacterium]